MIRRRLFLAILCSVLVPFTARPAAQAQQAASAPLESLAGEYASAAEPDTPLNFHVDDGRLVYDSERRLPIALEAVAPTLFKVHGSKSTVRFSLDADGRPVSVTLSFDSGTVYKRIGPAVHRVFHDYQRSEAMIPMRDGVKLHVVILKPTDIAAPLPILLERTPYGAGSYNQAIVYASRPDLARDGYIFVVEDIRGRYKSEGEFIMMHPLADHRDPKATDESTDAYDTVDWLVKNLPGNNSRVGVLGTSYDGFLSMMAGIDPHPAVKAVSPQAPMIDVWRGDDFFHNGAFRQSYGYDYVLGLESSKEDTEVSYGKDAGGKPVDGFDYFLHRGSFAEDVNQSGAKLLPTWQLFLDHPAYDSVWNARGVENHLEKVAVPTLSVGGTYDQEDMYGPQEEYAQLEPHDARGENFLVLGPWRHGSWNSSSRRLGNIEYGEPIGTEFRQRIEARFFAHYLKDEPGFDLEDTASFQTGSNTWKRYAHFPPAEARTARLHIDSAGQLGWKADSKPATTSYLSDPASPVPYRHRPIQPTYGQGSEWRTWLTEDQRFVADRKDVAIWKLPVLKNDLTITGSVVADIFASTTGSDADLVVKLIDQYPYDDSDPKMRGYQLMTNAEIFRGRYLSGFDRPAPIAPGAIREYKFSLHDVDHVFKAGHTVMVEIQSSWFPLYDRNPQTFVPNIMKATPADYKPATITIHSGPGHDSALELPVIEP